MRSQLPAPFNVILQAAEDWWDHVFSLSVMGLLWVVCWVTVILGPPATVGLYYVVNELTQGHNPGLRGMVEGGRRFLLKSWLWGLLNLLAAVVFFVGFVFYGQIRAVWGALLQGVVLLMALIWWGAQVYVLPYLMEQEQQDLRLALRNGLLTTFASPLYTFVLLLVTVVLLVVSVVIIFPLIAGAPGLIAALGTRAVLERIETFGVRDSEGPPGGNGRG
jgi:uncharacterized membrane protein YesL